MPNQSRSARLPVRHQPTRARRPHVSPQTRQKAALTGSAIAAGFGTAWALWGAAGLPAGAQVAVRAAGVAAGVVIVSRTVQLRRSALPASGSIVRSRAYRGVVAAEVVAIVAGGLGLNLTGHGEYVAAWVAAVVGLHFLAFGRLIARFYYPLGAAVTAGGLAGALVGLAGAGTAGVEATSGLIAAAALLVGSGYRTFRRPA